MIVLHGLQHKAIGVGDGVVVIKREKTLFVAERRKVIPISQITAVKMKSPGAIHSRRKQHCHGRYNGRRQR